MEKETSGITTEIKILHNVSGLQPKMRTKNSLTDLMGARRRKRWKNCAVEKDKGANRLKPCGYFKMAWLKYCVIPAHASRYLDPLAFRWVGQLVHAALYVIQPGQ